MSLAKIELINVVSNTKTTYKSNIIPRSGDMIAIASDVYKVLEVVHNIQEEEYTSLLVYPINIKESQYLN